MTVYLKSRNKYNKTVGLKPTTVLCIMNSTRRPYHCCVESKRICDFFLSFLIIIDNANNLPRKNQCRQNKKFVLKYRSQMT